MTGSASKQFRLLFRQSKRSILLMTTVRTYWLNNKGLILVVSRNSSCRAVSLTMFPPTYTNDIVSCDYCCFLRIPFHQLASPPGFHATHISRGNLVYMWIHMNKFVERRTQGSIFPSAATITSSGKALIVSVVNVLRRVRF